MPVLRPARAAEKLMVEGRVSVNNIVVRQLGTRANWQKDEIRIDGPLISCDQERTVSAFIQTSRLCDNIERSAGETHYHNPAAGYPRKSFSRGKTRLRLGRPVDFNQ